MDRREFAGSLAAAVIGVRGPGTGVRRVADAAATAPGSRTRGPVLSPLGVQLYTVRAEAQRDLPGTLARLAQIGYREVEFWNYYGRTPAQVAGLLAENGLTSPSVHIGLEQVEGDAAAATFAAAREIGHRYLVVAWTPAEWRRTPADWRRLADRLQAAGVAAQGYGLQLAYHNHDFEFTPLEGTVPYDLLVRATDSGHLQLQVDIFWMMKGGRDVVAFFRDHPGRIASVHVKDRLADGTMTDVGAGTIDWRTVLGEARRTGVRHFFVEHDEPADAMASVAASYRYLERLAL